MRALKGSATPVSGQALADELKISRAALWKHIKKLRDSGYVIAGAPRVGYRLEAVPEKLMPVELEDELAPVFKGQVLCFESLGSTNDLAKEKAARGEFRRAGLVVAETQAGGRGRLGRAWASPHGGIWMSLVVRPDLSISDASRVPLLASVVIAEALAEQLRIKPGIKWPNDILVNGKKAAGVLTELAAEWGGVEYLIIGIGVNANFHARELGEHAPRATTLIDETGTPVDRLRLAARIINGIWEELPLLSQGFESVLSRWRERSVTLGRTVTVANGAETVRGTAVDLDAQGGLIVEVDGGERRVFRAGEVSLGSSVVK